MQVPIVMTNSLGQKISTVAVQSANSSLFTTAPTNTGSATGANAPKVLIQTMPTMVPATAENGDKITVQLAKIFTIPATQLTQCQLQAKLGTPTSINLMGARSEPLRPYVCGAGGAGGQISSSSPAESSSGEDACPCFNPDANSSSNLRSDGVYSGGQFQFRSRFIRVQLSPKAELKPDSTSAEQPKQDNPTQEAAAVVVDSNPQSEAES